MSYLAKDCSALGLDVKRLPNGYTLNHAIFDTESNRCDRYSASVNKRVYRYKIICQNLNSVILKHNKINSRNIHQNRLRNNLVIKASYSVG